ncbi:6065_t:CDS:2, partial [Entrophospora sp. SA101]
LLPSNVSHYSNQILDKYWLLLISGTLNLQNYGIVNATLFDGENIYPFILASKDNEVFSLGTQDLYPTFLRLQLGFTSIQITTTLIIAN